MFTASAAETMEIKHASNHREVTNKHASTMGEELHPQVALEVRMELLYPKIHLLKSL
jgi:hypothetical protein